MEDNDFIQAMPEGDIIPDDEVEVLGTEAPIDDDFGIEIDVADDFLGEDSAFVDLSDDDQSYGQEMDI